MVLKVPLMFHPSIRYVAPIVFSEPPHHFVFINFIYSYILQKNDRWRTHQILE